MPPLVDLAEAKWRTDVSVARTAEPVFVYAGVPGKKDLLGNILRACGLVAETGGRFRLVVAGPSRLDVEAALDAERISRSSLDHWIEVRGTVEQASVPRLLARSDFSILARLPRRYAMAGFPTKVVESMAAGTPPVLNLTGDLGEFIRDGENGIVARDHSPAELAKAIHAALGMDPGARSAMRRRARRTAESCFDYRVFVDALGAFVGRVATRRRQMKSGESHDDPNRDRRGA